MKKYFPILVFIMVFTAVLAGQITFDLMDSTAGPGTKKKSLYAHYESIYNKLKVTSTNGEEINIPKLNSKFIVLNFWASWCTPCLAEFSSIVNMKKKFGDNVIKVIGINSDETRQMQNIKKISKMFSLNFPIVADNQGKIHQDFLVSAIPVSIIFKDGKVFEVSKGSKDFMAEEFLDELRQKI
ncbi:MAG: TlpA family protein disulfide reductase [Bacteriovoracaceae bacterium]|nr:TlpA family protein disulfide reductase [Bacteriovoracaceae bacterium]